MNEKMIQKEISELKGEIDFLHYALTLTFELLPLPKRQSAITAIEVDDIEDILQEQLEKTEMSVREEERLKAYFRGYENGQSRFLNDRPKTSSTNSPRIGFVSQT